MPTDPLSGPRRWNLDSIPRLPHPPALARPLQGSDRRRATRAVLSLLLLSFLPVRAQEPLIVEPEQAAALAAPMQVFADDTSYGGGFLMSPSANSGQAALAFEIDVPGTYFVWCRVLAPSVANDSFCVLGTNGQVDVFDVAERRSSPSWQWSVLNGRGCLAATCQTCGGTPEAVPRRPFSFGAGLNTITFLGRDPGTKLDRLMLTTDPGFVPVDEIMVGHASTIEPFAGGTTSVVFPIRLRTPPAAPVSLAYVTSNDTARAGVDYVAASGVLTFGIGETSKTVSVTVVGDIPTGGCRSFFLRVTGPDAGTAGNIALGTIYDRNKGVYLRSALSLPFTVTNFNEAALDRVFCPGNWRDLRFETVVLSELFATNTGCLFIDGGGRTADELEEFLCAHLSELEDWVATGGALFLNCGAGEGDGVDFGFGSETLFPEVSSSGTAVDPTHPIFNGPFLPVGTSWTGNAFARGALRGSAFTRLIRNSTDNALLVKRAYGAGWVLLGTMTTHNFHTPQGNAGNLRANILDYVRNCYNPPGPRPEIIFSPASQSVLPGGYLTLKVTARALTPLEYQWFHDDAPMPGATHRHLSLTNVSSAEAGRYAVTVSNALGILRSDDALVSLQPAPAGRAAVPLWHLPFGRHEFLSAATNRPQAIAYNPTANQLLVLSYKTSTNQLTGGQLSTNQIHVLDAATGLELSAMTMPAAATNDVLKSIAVGEDGVVYAAALTTNAAEVPLKIYQWIDTTPEAVGKTIWQGDPGGAVAPGQRWGDTLAVRGSLPQTTLLLGSRTSPHLASFVADVEFALQTCLLEPPGAHAGDFSAGLALGADETIWAASSTGKISRLSFDANLCQAFILGTRLESNSVAGLAVDPARNIMATLAVDTPDHVRLYDLEPPQAPRQIDTDPIPSDNPNRALIGAVTFGPRGVYVFDAKNGLFALRVGPRLRSSGSCANVRLTWGPGAVLQAAPTVDGLYLDVPGAVSPYLINACAGPNRFFRLRE